MLNDINQCHTVKLTDRSCFYRDKARAIFDGRGV